MKNKDNFTRINENKTTLNHLVIDVLSIALSHVIFYSKYDLPYSAIFTSLFPESLEDFWLPISSFIILTIWILAFYISGHYANTSRKSGLQIIGPTLSVCIFLSVAFFFTLTLYTHIDIESKYLPLAIRYFSFTFTAIFVFRMILISRYQHRLKNGKIGSHGILIGNNKNAADILNRLNQQKFYKGYKYIGYVANNKNGIDLSDRLPNLGNIDDLKQIIENNSFDEAIISLHEMGHRDINKVINIIRKKNIIIKLSTDIDNIIEGTLKTQNLENSPYITITNCSMPTWQKVVKLIIDYLLASIGIILSSPICIAIAIGVKLSSGGPIFFKQQRIGKHHKPFILYKFRSMYADSEKDGPALSSDNDARITPLGKLLRKWHLDEIPQFFNVIMGEMSLVGPRPERKFFIDQILPNAPHYEHLFSTKPGITSWGMVKYGYAENVNQMLERLQYDIFYMENRTLVVDLKIMLYTIRSVICGDGK